LEDAKAGPAEGRGYRGVGGAGAGLSGVRVRHVAFPVYRRPTGSARKFRLTGPLNRPPLARGPYTTDSANADPPCA